VRRVMSGDRTSTPRTLQEPDFPPAKQARVKLLEGVVRRMGGEPELGVDS